MLEEAVYYSRREAEERQAALRADDERVQHVHLLLAEKYAELARRELADVETLDARSVSAVPAARATIEQLRRYR